MTAAVIASLASQGCASNPGAFRLNYCPGGKAAILQTHNALRAQHNSPPLAWSTDLATVAKDWLAMYAELTLAQNLANSDISEWNNAKFLDNLGTAYSTSGATQTRLLSEFVWTQSGDFCMDAVHAWVQQGAGWNYTAKPYTDNDFKARALGNATDGRGTYYKPNLHGKPLKPVPYPYDADVGDFTQMIWKGTKQVGCAAWRVQGYDAYDLTFICLYHPPANTPLTDAAFLQNVGRPLTPSPPTPPTPPPSPRPSSFPAPAKQVYVPNPGFSWGTDDNVLRYGGSDGPEGCFKMCQEWNPANGYDGTCFAWVYTPLLGKDQNEECDIHASGPPGPGFINSDVDAISGTLTGEKAGWKNGKCAINQDWDWGLEAFPPSDFAPSPAFKVIHNVTTAAQCCALCAADGYFFAWTWMKGVCTLKGLNQVSQGFVRRLGMASGTMKGDVADDVSLVASCVDGYPALDTINAVRARHGAPAVTWSADLVKQAKALAKTWSYGPLPNLAPGTSVLPPARLPYQQAYMPLTWDAPRCVDAIKLWAAQGSTYIWDKTPYKSNGGNATDFAQMVWKATKSVGCATFTGNGVMGPSADEFLATDLMQIMNITVCVYSPPGTVPATDAAWAQNVGRPLAPPPKGKTG